MHDLSWLEMTHTDCWVAEALVIQNGQHTQAARPWDDLASSTVLQIGVGSSWVEPRPAKLSPAPDEGFSGAQLESS